jgi:phosphatidylinositol-4,5-bisphosphate 3-kinase
MTNAVKDENKIVLMLKVGDDLRQDALILQLLKIMNDLWRKEGLEMQMSIYGCISTGFERGLLEVVLNSSTLGGVLLNATDKGKNAVKSGSIVRKMSSAMKALNDYGVIRDWIWEKVCEDITDEGMRAEEMDKRIQNFLVSTAAYCVASYVLGLGDRHNDNLMISRVAKFFHIDFGHILGNFKSKYGIKRERAPMVFTHAMKNVMRADQFDTFVELCCDVYNVLRRHSSLLVSLFSLAIPCNLPELQSEEDVVWIHEKLLVGKSDEEAAAHFRSELDLSLNTRGTRINDAVHMIAHA